VKATAAVAVGIEGGSSRYDVLRSDPPLLLRPTPEGLQLVGGAAGPLGGDELRYRIEVAAEAALTVRSVAASMVLPGPNDSTLDITAAIDRGASLDWAPQPLISVVGSRHRQRTDVTMAVDATLRWREVLVLGRTHEPPGSFTTILRVERGGRPLTHQELRIGAGATGWDGPAGIAHSRVLVTELVVGPGDHTTRVTTDGDSRAGVLAIADDASVRTSLGPDLAAAVAVLAELGGR
jgi:urease accessory protein